MSKRNRSNSKVLKLPKNIKNKVDDMITEGYTYKEIMEYIKNADVGMDISVSSLQRYAARYLKAREAILVNSEYIRNITEETNKYPNMDISEPILRILGVKLLDVVQELNEDALSTSDPIKLINAITSLIRTTSLKATNDTKNKALKNLGFEEVKTMIFEVMAKEQPELYEKVSKFIDDIESD